MTKLAVLMFLLSVAGCASSAHSYQFASPTQYGDGNAGQNDQQ